MTINDIVSSVRGGLRTGLYMATVGVASMGYGCGAPSEDDFCEYIAECCEASLNCDVSSENAKTLCETSIAGIGGLSQSYLDCALGPGQTCSADLREDICGDPFTQRVVR